MKKAICTILILSVIVVSFCGCGSSSSNSSSVELSSTQAWRLFKQELVSKVENTFGNKVYALNKFSYECTSFEDIGSQYEIEGNYDVYLIDGKYSQTYGFSGTIDKSSKWVYIESIFKAAN